MNEKIQELLNAVGAMAEMCKASYDSFIAAGFASPQAMMLTQTFLQTSLRMNQGRSRDED